MVFAIEPNRENIWFLKQNVTYNTMNIKVIEKAISDKKTESNFYYEDGMGALGSLVNDQYFKNKKFVKIEVDTLDNSLHEYKTFPFYSFNMFAIHQTQKSELQKSDIFSNCNR